MTKVTLIFLSITVVIIGYFFVRPTTAIPVATVVLPDTILRNGDIIFRDGRGAISSIFRRMSLTDNSYSHAGIIHKDDGEIFVYHVIGGEGNNAVMRKDKLITFCNRNEAFAFGVYRSDLDPGSIDSLAGIYFSKQIKFDDKFDLMTDDKMYCTELVYKVLKEVSAENNFLSLTTLRNIKYCSCDNIFLSPHMKKIISYKY